MMVIGAQSVQHTRIKDFLRVVLWWRHRPLPLLLLTLPVTVLPGKEDFHQPLCVQRLLVRALEVGMGIKELIIGMSLLLRVKSR